MEKEIIARHFSLGEDQSSMIEEAVDKLERFSPRPVQSLKLTINHEAGQFFSDGVLNLKNHQFRAKGEGREPEVSVVEFVENIRKQLGKFKGKVSGKQKGEDGGLGKAMLDGEMLLGDEETSEGFVLRDMDPEVAKEAFLQDDLPFLVFRNVQSNRLGVVYQKDNGDLALMESTNN